MKLSFLRERQLFLLNFNFIFMVLDNQRAAEIFSAYGLFVKKENVYPVVLSRIGFKNHTELQLLCWAVRDIKQQVFVRVDTGAVIPRPDYCSARELKMFEGFVDVNGVFYSLILYDLDNKNITFKLDRYEKVVYRRIIG